MSSERSKIATATAVATAADSSPHAVEKRKLQNREAQRRYRENIKLKLKQAEMQMSNRPRPPSSHRSSLTKDSAPFNMDADSSNEDLMNNHDEASLAVAGRNGDQIGLGSNCSSPFMETDFITSFVETTPHIEFDLVSSPIASTNKRNSLGGCSQSNTTIAHLAARKGHHSMIRILFDFGIDLTTQDSSGQTSLHLAAAHGYPDTVLALIDVGVNVDIKNALGQTPLFIAVSMGQDSTVKALLQNGADVNINT
ncbi:ankyrin repeat-containing protein [Rutstroemia sp. NJR-2017a WRK4]|nr:ankyrin repeat-containing protein [Rutstroemia sp. NJR-2017a WRK4]